ncbi:MAG: FimV/HubP family polar landmark protein [Sulfuriferula sp.]
MHKKKMVSCLSAAMLLLAQAPAYSAGLGKLSINSALGQPLNAEIEVLATDPTELATLQARMASPEAYRNANVDMTGVLSSLKFVLEKRPGGRSVLKVSSNKPINDPFVDMLIELNWGGGQMVREYTLLLDPPGMGSANTNNNITVTPATTSTPTSATSSIAPVAEKSSVNNVSNERAATKVAPEKALVPKTVVKPKTVPPVASKLVEVAPAKTESAAPSNDLAVMPATITAKRGSTLSSLAKEVKPEGVKLEQMLVGLYRQNPSAFDGNMNQMKAGKILKVPSKEEVAAISQADAVREIKLQANDWHSYRQKLAGEVAAAPAAETKSTPNVGKITPKVEDKAAPAKSGQDVLKLSKGEAPATNTQAANAAKPAKPTTAELKQAAQDEAVAKQKALKEANDRAAALEKNIKDMQRLVELKNQSMANMQKEAAKPAAIPVPPAVKPEAKPEVKPEAAPAVVKKPVVKPVVPAPVPVAEQAWYEDINPLYAAGGAVGALLLALLGFMAKSRSRRANLSKFENSIMTNVAAKPNTVYGTQGGAVVNTNNTSFLTDFSQSGLGSLDTHDVDPIAEAEVYMAYGRDAQAEEILKEAMVKDPARHEIKLKLLEIYAGRKNLPAFESIATELYSALAGENTPVWEKAAELGRSLDPNNPLYGGSASAAPAAEKMVEPVVAAAAVSAMLAEEPAEIHTAPVDEGVMDLSGALDFDGESFDANDTVSDKAVAADSISTEGMLDMSEFELPATFEPVALETSGVMDFDVPAVDAHHEVAAEAEQPAEVGANAAEVSVHDENMLNFDFSVDEPAHQETVAEATPVATTEDIALDFSGISFDFDEPEVVEAAASSDKSAVAETIDATEAVAEHPAEISAAPELSEAEQEVKTKLDLAQVYLEMGDTENAREILQEVMQEGNAQQQEQAHAFLQQAG